MGIFGIESISISIKMNSMRKGIVIFSFVFVHCLLYAQPIPETGKPIPDFRLTDVRYYSSSDLDRRSSKGKWVILDFFSKGCSACFASFPKVNKLNEQFKDKLDIILVGKRSGNDDIEEIFEKFRVRQHLKLPVAFDSLLFKRWEITGVPYVVWIDNDGIVKAITGSQDLTAENIESFLMNEPFRYLDLSLQSGREVTRAHDIYRPLTINEHGEEEPGVLYRSLFSAFNPATRQLVLRSIDCLVVDGIAKNEGRFEICGATMEMLYEFAYSGAENNMLFNHGLVYPFPLLNVKDPSAFEYDFTSGKNLYNYSMVVPIQKATRAYLMEVMQRDLKNYFGYEVSVEPRRVPYWALTKSEKNRNKIKTASDTIEIMDGSHAGYDLKNISIARLIRIVSGYHQNEPPIIDETGIDYLVDVHIDAIMTDLTAIKMALETQGFSLQKKEKNMLAIVIRDP